MKARWQAAVCAVLGLTSTVGLARAGEQPKAPTEDQRQGPEPPPWHEQAKKPTEWLTFGGDLRLRYTYLKNPFDLENDTRDNRGFFRIRTRLWAKAGPFLQDDALEVPNGLTFYTRLTHEPRYAAQWVGHPPETPMWDEVIVDNLWVDWQRINGLPISLKIGRQDIAYGDPSKHQGLVLIDPTVLESTRSSYSDAIKATLHLDEWKATLDLIAMHNRGDQQRLPPLGNKDRAVLEYTQSLYAAYFRSKMFEGHELGAYYIYKNEDRERWANPALAERKVHTVGIPLVGTFCKDWDHYLEGAYQWGTEGNARRNSYAINSDLGYTIANCAWSPRVHAGFEFLSGDDPRTSDFEGWDPVMSRYPQWSELLSYRWATETGMAFYWTNVERYTIGASCRPTEKMLLCLDHSLLRGDEKMAGALYGTGKTRGTLTVAKLTYEFTRNASMHIWTEWFHPQSYYVGTADSALFIRTQFVFKF